MKDEDKQEELDPAAEIAKLTAKIKLNKIIILSVLAVSLITFSILLTSAGYFYTQLKQLKAKPSPEFQAEFSSMDRELKNLSTFLEAESRSLKAYHLRINLLQEECGTANSEQRLSLHRNREQDFQQMLDEMLTGSQQLSNMSKGSKLWFEPYQRRLETLKKRSASRAADWISKK